MSNRLSTVHFSDELDDEVASALHAMLSEKPNQSSLRRALDSLHNPDVELPAKIPSRSKVGSFRSVAAALALLAVLWTTSQTTAWGQVAQDFAEKASEGSSILDETSNNPTEPRDKTVPHPALNFILMLHIAALLIGLGGLFLTWILGSLEFFLHNKFGQSPQFSSWRRKIHVGAITLYGSGIVLGCIWAQSTWGLFWRWDPREAFALFALTIGSLWYLATADVSSNKRSLRFAAIACCSFWLIILSQVLSNLYVATQHSYGVNPAMSISSIVVVLMVLNLGCLFAVRWIQTEPSPSTS